MEFLGQFSTLFLESVLFQKNKKILFLFTTPNFYSIPLGMFGGFEQTFIAVKT